MARYIDADEALIMMQHSKEDAPSYGDWYMAHDSCIDCVNTAPTADVVEVKHGEWKPTEPDSDVRFFCSECETEISTSWDYDNAEMWRYCPNCGAKMDGRSNTNDR